MRCDALQCVMPQKTLHLPDDLDGEVRAISDTWERSFNWTVKELLRLGLCAAATKGSLVVPAPDRPSWQEQVAEDLDEQEAQDLVVGQFETTGHGRSSGDTSPSAARLSQPPASVVVRVRPR